MINDARSKLLLRGVLFMAAYFVLARTVPPFQIGAITVSPVWLPHGLSVAAVLIFGWRFWPVVALAVVTLAVIPDSLSLQIPVAPAIALGFAKAAEVLLAVALIRGPGRFTGSLDSVRNVLALVIGGGVLASIPGAILSVTFLSVSGLAPWSRFTELASTWWLGDAMGVLIVVPVVLAFVTPRRWSFDKKAVTSLVIIGSALFIVCELAFGGRLSTSAAMPLAYLPFPFIFWASLRFGVHGAALASSLAALHATIGTIHGFGPFVRESPLESLFLLETFLAVMVLSGLLLGAVISERKSVAHALRDSQKRYHLASSAGHAGVWDWDLVADSHYVDPVLKNILGYEAHEIANTIEAWDKMVYPGDLELVQSASIRHREGKTPHFEVEHRLVHKDGSIRWFFSRGEAQRDGSGRAIRFTGTAVDVTRQKLAEEALEAGKQKIREQLSELEQIYQTAPIGLALTDLDHRYVRMNERLAAMNGRSVEEHIGRTIRELTPNVADRVEPIMRRVIETGESHLGEVETSTLAWSGTALVGHYPLLRADGTVHGVGVIVQDITPHKKSEVLQAGNTRALELVAQGRSLSEVMDVLAHNVESSTTGQSCIIRLVSDDGQTLKLIAAPSLPASRDVALNVLPISSYGGTCGNAARAGRAVVTPDISRDPAWASLHAAAATLGLRSCWSVPILGSRNDVLGTVALLGAETGSPSEADMDAAKNAAHLARVALEHARAREALTKSESSLRESHDQVRHLAQRLIAAQEEERRRVSRELHDGLNQQLAALSFEIGKLRSKLADDAPEVGERLSELQNRTAHLIDDARRMSHELHPSMLEHLGLVAAVRSYCDEETHRGSVAVRFDPIRPPESISPETSLCLFRVVQEGVRNAAKHSGATAVQVTLRSANGSILLAIADNGSGFDTSADRNGGLGLISMAERVRAIGGRFNILSDPSEGTRLEVSLPAL